MVPWAEPGWQAKTKEQRRHHHRCRDEIDVKQGVGDGVHKPDAFTCRHDRSPSEVEQAIYRVSSVRGVMLDAEIEHGAANRSPHGLAEHAHEDDRRSRSAANGIARARLYRDHPGGLGESQTKADDESPCASPDRPPGWRQYDQNRRAAKQCQRADV